MKPRGLIYLSIAIGCIALGMGIGIRWQRSDHVVAAATNDPPTVTEKQAELAKLAVAAGAIRRSLDQPAQPGPVSGGSPASISNMPLAPGVTARDERDAHLARLESSGSAPAEFLSSMRSVDKEWRALARSEHVDVQMTSWRCFQAGCSATGTFKDPEKIESLSARASDTKSFHEWPGPKFRSGPIAVPGGTEITWIFFAPERQGGVSVNDPNTPEK